MLASFSRTDFLVRLSCLASWRTFLDPAYCRRKSSSRFDQRRKLLRLRLKPSLRARSQQAWNGHPVRELICRVADRLWSHPLLYPCSRSASSSGVQSYRRRVFRASPPPAIVRFVSASIRLISSAIRSFADLMTLVPQKKFSDLLSFVPSERHLICRGEISDTIGSEDLKIGLHGVKTVQFGFWA